MDILKCIFRYSLFTSNLCDCSVFLFVKYGILIVYADHNLGYLSDLYNKQTKKQTEEFHTEYRDIIFLHPLKAPAICCNKQKPGFS